MAIELSGGLRLVWNWDNLLSHDLIPRIINIQSGKTLCRLEGHTDMIRGGQWLPGGRVVTWSNDASLRIWDIHSGECLALLTGHSRYICSVYTLADGSLASWSDDHTLRVWDPNSGRCIRCLDTNPWLDAIMAQYTTDPRVLPDVECLVKADAGTLVLWEKKTSRIGIWSLTQGTQTHALYHAPKYPGAYDFGQLFDLPGNFFVSHSWSNGAAIIWSTRTGRPSGTFDGRWDGMLGFPRRLLCWRHHLRSNDFQILDLKSCSPIVQSTVHGTRPSQVHRYGDGFAVWLEDFRLLLLNEQLEVIATLPQPFRVLAGVKVFDPYQPVPDPASLAAHIEHTDPNAVRYFSPGNSAPSALEMRAHFHSNPFCSDIQYRLTPDTPSLNRNPSNSNPDTTRPLVAQFTSWPSQRSDMLLEFARDQQGSLFCQDIHSAIHRMDFHEQSNTAPFTLSPPSGVIGGAEFWCHVYRTPRLVMTPGGYSPDQSLSRWVSIADPADPPWHLLSARKQRLRLTADGDLLFWNIEHRSSLCLLQRQDDRLVNVELVTKDDELDRVQGRMVIAPDGAIHFLTEHRLTPLLNPHNDRPVRVSPDTRRYSTSHYWADNQQLAILRERDILIIDATTGNTIATLVTPFDGRAHGVALLQQQRWVAWTRSELASWCAQTFQPLFRIQEPGEWGPGYENVVPLASGELAYCSGSYSGDNRIVVWDGADRMDIVHAHDQEVVHLYEAGDGYLISHSEADRYCKWFLPFRALA
ncbi:MAG: hypothetical protein VYA55_07815 [Pseudomonadota bacterium]|nr:hypothetical protein [Pseudomonadota bacterium]